MKKTILFTVIVILNFSCLSTQHIDNYKIRIKSVDKIKTASHKKLQKLKTEKVTKILDIKENINKLEHGIDIIIGKIDEIKNMDEESCTNLTQMMFHYLLRKDFSNIVFSKNECYTIQDSSFSLQAKFLQQLNHGILVRFRIPSEYNSEIIYIKGNFKYFKNQTVNINDILYYNGVFSYKTHTGSNDVASFVKYSKSKLLKVHKKRIKKLHSKIRMKEDKINKYKGKLKKLYKIYPDLLNKFNDYELAMNSFTRINDTNMKLKQNYKTTLKEYDKLNNEFQECMMRLFFLFPLTIFPIPGCYIYYNNKLKGYYY